MTYREQFGNDHRAAHRVTVFPFGTNVRIPYRGFQISLAADGAGILILRADGTDAVGVSEIFGTSGESILWAMKIIDSLQEVE